MPSTTVRSILLIGLAVSALAADDPFVGKWKLNLAKSKLTGQIIQIEEVSGGSYKFKEDEHSDIVFVDGLDHPTHFGDTMAITQKTPDTWAIIYKRGDRVLMNTIGKVSQDG